MYVCTSCNQDCTLVEFGSNERQVPTLIFLGLLCVCVFNKRPVPAFEFSSVLITARASIIMDIYCVDGSSPSVMPILTAVACFRLHTAI